MGEPSSDAQSLVAVPAELVDAAKAVEYLLDGLTSGFKSLDTDVQSLLRTWQGYQGGLFAEGYAEVKQGLADLLGAMGDTTVALNTSAEAYLAQEHANTEAIQSVASSLDLPDAS